MSEIEEKALENTRVQDKVAEIARLRTKAKFFWPYVGISLLFVLVAVLSFFAKIIPAGLAGVIVAGIFALQAIKASDAFDTLENMGAVEEAKRAKSVGFKIFIGILAVVLIIVGAYIYFYSRMEASRESEKWDKLAIVTSMEALEQFAPGTDYGPRSADGWLVIHNNDGTTTVWAPRVYGRIALMLTDDGESYTPYWISVNDTVVLDSSK
ncbi:MAG: hypothetical protein HFF04_00955 [Oscillospiraceae bacterium]|nr:hypothetical protein [Oscillospiraceae bacterium]